ncbi:hypothetical protein F5Y16DRAFT_340423 [Xylariaceae sp. FL0255]|nr:hypothetical protein F5Y16DRAFT_340423 [Xylariaceae sp. FL0255]
MFYVHHTSLVSQKGLYCVFSIEMCKGCGKKSGIYWLRYVCAFSYVAVVLTLVVGCFQTHKNWHASRYTQTLGNKPSDPVEASSNENEPFTFSRWGFKRNRKKQVSLSWDRVKRLWHLGRRSECHTIKFPTMSLVSTIALIA